MKCYNCGEPLSKHNFCMKCGSDVRKYKKIIAMSNVFYNDGLEKASVRDLSGAINSLHQCIKLNKNHIEARNLLGLIYFEIGDHVVAFKEWVISKNLQPTHNRADYFLDMIQNNPGRLEQINQIAKKYNQGLLFCQQGNYDLAVIQIRKVLSMNPKFLYAHQLLALLYMQRESWEKAKKELDRCVKIDKNNTMTLRYLRELETIMMGDEVVGKKEDDQDKKDGVVTYLSGNEVIIQPVNVKEPKVFSSIFNVVIGIFIGLFVAWFLILPSQIQKERTGLNDDLKTVSEQLDLKTVTIAELETKVSVLTEEKEALSKEMAAYVGTDGTLSNMENLMNAVSTYIESPEDLESIGGYLQNIDKEQIMEGTSETFVKLYQSLLSQVGPTLSLTYYETGMSSYENGDYEVAIENLSQAYMYDVANGDALFYLGSAYRKSDDRENALRVYKEMVEKFPGTKKETSALNYIAELEAS